MTRLMIAGATLGVVTLLTGGAPARADFYSLDGRFQCLDSKAAVCGDADPVVHAMPPAPVVQPMPAAGPAQIAPPETAQRVTPAPTDDPMLAIAKRVQSGAATGSDLVWLRQAAHAQNGRAVELLAWCVLRGIGTPSDPIQAYILYGIAASNGLPHARDNQALVYEQDLTSEQRQQLLNLTDNGMTVAQIAR
jgi:hypothetical protein